MMKRELGRLTGPTVDIDAPRTKRRKDVAAEEADVVMEDANADLNQVRVDGIKLWTTIREAVNKEGRTLSNDFFRLPSKRQYVDYYQQTKHPVSLEDVKNRLDSGQYRSLEAVKLDLETCFRNAKKYNMKDSQIWKDAKHLHKLVTKEYTKMTGTAEDTRVDVENEGDDNAAVVGASDDEGGKRRKVPNLTRLLKSRLQKLVDKTDDTGRVLSSEFMDLPNKKQWPVYYKTIKRPQCLENIFKHLKRKEYHASLDFGRDVELVFSNAMEFNAENSQIYEDARILRDYFHQLMADLPPPHALPEYSTHASGSKIMLKVPAASTPYISTSTTPVATNHTTSLKSSGSVLLRVPGLHPTSNDSQQPAQSHPGNTYISPPIVTQKLPPVAIPRTTTQIIPHQLTPSTSYASTSHYPNASYHHQPAEHPSPISTYPAASPLTQVYDVNSHANALSHALSKSPVPSPTRVFRCMLLCTKPQERKLELDHREGVKVWAMRLGKNETTISVTGIRFVTDEEEEDDIEDRRDSDREEEEEEEEEVPEIKVKGRGRKKGKGKAALKAAKTNAKRRKLSPPQVEEVSVRINGSVVKAKAESSGEWDVDIPLGSGVLEVSEKGGAVWKVHLDRSV